MDQQKQMDFDLEIFQQQIQNQLRVINWASGPGRREVEELYSLLPNPILEFPGELTLVGRCSVHHWDDIDPLLSKLQHIVGDLFVEVDDPGLRVRTYKASGHPFLTVRLRVEVVADSELLAPGVRPNDNPLWDYFWIDRKRER